MSVWDMPKGALSPAKQAEEREVARGTQQRWKYTNAFIALGFPLSIAGVLAAIWALS